RNRNQGNHIDPQNGTKKNQRGKSQARDHKHHPQQVGDVESLLRDKEIFHQEKVRRLDEEKRRAQIGGELQPVRDTLPEINGLEDRQFALVQDKNDVQEQCSDKHREETQGDALGSLVRDEEIDAEENGRQYRGNAQLQEQPVEKVELVIHQVRGPYPLLEPPRRPHLGAWVKGLPLVR